jgi:hypothetical protein
MIFRYVLQSLSPDELGMLLYITRVLHPPGFEIETNENVLSTYKQDAILQICAHYKDRVLPECMPIHDSMLAKLNGVIPNDATEAPKPDQHDNIVGP